MKLTRAVKSVVVFLVIYCVRRAASRNYTRTLGGKDCTQYNKQPDTTLKRGDILHLTLTTEQMSAGLCTFFIRLPQTKQMIVKFNRVIVRRPTNYDWRDDGGECFPMFAFNLYQTCKDLPAEGSTGEIMRSRKNGVSVQLNNRKGNGYLKVQMAITAKDKPPEVETTSSHNWIITGVVIFAIILVLTVTVAWGRIYLKRRFARARMQRSQVVANPYSDGHTGPADAPYSVDSVATRVQPTAPTEPYPIQYPPGPPSIPYPSRPPFTSYPLASDASTQYPREPPSALYPSTAPSVPNQQPTHPSTWNSPGAPPHTSTHTQTYHHRNTELPDTNNQTDVPPPSYESVMLTQRVIPSND